MKIILIGIQGSGKSTQGNLLSEKLKIPYLSTGHIFREMAKEKTPEGRYIKETINAGILIPNEKTNQIVNEYISRPEYKSGYILDGFPRTVHQAQNFEENIDFVIYLKVSDKEALWRISGRDEERDDETLKAIRKRIELFHEHTKPVLDFYKSKGLLIEIDGEQTIEEIYKELLEKLKNGNK
jgi:adenylate kinase